jgi:uncharacterized repeat protein (TIGR04076 family)
MLDYHVLTFSHVCFCDLFYLFPLFPLRFLSPSSCHLFSSTYLPLLSALYLLTSSLFSPLFFLSHPISPPIFFLVLPFLSLHLPSLHSPIFFSLPFTLLSSCSFPSLSSPFPSLSSLSLPLPSLHSPLVFSLPFTLLFLSLPFTVVSAGKYSLLAVISHLGRCTDHGHYVCHIKKEGQWIFYNDEKVEKEDGVVCNHCLHSFCSYLFTPSFHYSSQVAQSKVPPLDLGFMYLFKRDV